MRPRHIATLETARRAGLSDVLALGHDLQAAEDRATHAEATAHALQEEVARLRRELLRAQGGAVRPALVQAEA
jgi:hypothetical protein